MENNQTPSSKNAKNPTSSNLKPVQLIKFDQKKNIHLTPEATQIFNKLQSKQLCIVCVAGKYRTGKSYILNRVLLQQNHGFQVGPTINACTKGLWMWPEIVKINFYGHQKQCIIVDTEGLGSLEQGQNTDLKIFLMAMLLSSYLIYNSVGSIDQKALESLNLIINMASLLQKSGDRFDSQDLINSFPSFMWLVRDFSLRLQDENGVQITSQQYLQNALRTQKGKSAATERKNQIRKQLRTFFQQRDCFTLIRPTLNQKDLQNLSTLPQKKLRPQFLDLIKQLKQRIHLGIQPKRIRGKPLTPQGFIQLCNYYIQSINSGKIPSINSNWDNLCISQSFRLIKKYQLRLKEYIQLNNLRKQGQQIANLEKFCQDLRQQADSHIDKSFLGKLEKKLLKEKLVKTLKQKMTEIYEKKNKDRQEEMSRQVTRLFAQYDDELKKINEQQASSLNPNKKILYSSLEVIYKVLHKIQEIKYDLFSGETEVTLERKSSFLNKIYQQFIEKLKSTYLSSIQSGFEALLQHNKQLETKLNHGDNTFKILFEEEKKKNLVLISNLQDVQRQYNRTLLMNKKLTQKFESINLKNIDLSKKLVEQKENFITKSQEYLNQIKLLQNQLQASSKNANKEILAHLDQLQYTNSRLAKQLHQIQIKQRKINRQCQIYKQNLVQKQKQTDELNKENQELKFKLNKLQRQKRALIRKTASSKNLNQTFSQGMFSASVTSFKDISKNQIELSQTMLQEDQHQDETKNDNQQMQELLNKLSLLQIQKSRLEQESKNFNSLYNEQKSLNSLLLDTAQSIKYQSLLKSYQVQRQNSLKTKRKLSHYEKVLQYVDKIQCIFCGQLFAKNSILQGNHSLKCLSNKIIELEFDVSYVYNSEGELNFLFELKTENRDQSLQWFELQGYKQIKWQVPKSLKNIRHFLKLLLKPQKDIELFLELKHSELSSHTKKESINSEQSDNLNQERRLYLEDLCHSLKPNIFKETFLIEFFAIDLHVFYKSRSTKQKQKEKITKKKKRGLLNLDLGQIIEQSNENESNVAQQKNNKALYGSMNFMKTSKFSMKKVFKFGPNV